MIKRLFFRARRQEREARKAAAEDKKEVHELIKSIHDWGKTVDARLKELERKVGSSARRDTSH